MKETFACRYMCCARPGDAERPADGRGRPAVPQGAG